MREHGTVAALRRRTGGVHPPPPSLGRAFPALGARPEHFTTGAPLNIYALVCHYDERTEHLAEMVRSIAPLVTGVVAVDGAYDLYPQGRARSPLEATTALHTACRRHRLSCLVYEPAEVWRGNEVEKRAALFSLACSLAVPYRDWFLIMDGDMTLSRCDVRGVKERLREAGECVAEVTLREADPNQGPFNPVGLGAFRSLFLAQPGMRVEGAHSNYVVPGGLYHDARHLWHAPPGETAEPALDLTDHLELFHRSHAERKPSREAGRRGYYRARSDAASERH